MALRFRLRGLAETFLDKIVCPKCGIEGNDDQNFVTDMSRVTMEGIVVVAQCNSCREIFIPASQRRGVINPAELRKAVEKDAVETGEPPAPGLEAVKQNVEKMNALRRGDLH